MARNGVARAKPIAVTAPMVGPRSAIPVPTIALASLPRRGVRSKHESKPYHQTVRGFVRVRAPPVWLVSSLDLAPDRASNPYPRAQGDTNRRRHALQRMATGHRAAGSNALGITPKLETPNTVCQH